MTTAAAASVHCIHRYTSHIPPLPTWVTHYEEQRAEGRVEVCALGGEREGGRAVAGGGVGVAAAALTIIR